MMFCDRLFDRFFWKLRPKLRIVTDNGRSKNCLSKFISDLSQFMTEVCDWLTLAQKKFFRPKLRAKKSITKISNRFSNEYFRSKKILVAELWRMKKIFWPKFSKIGHKVGWSLWPTVCRSQFSIKKINEICEKILRA